MSFDPPVGMEHVPLDRAYLRPLQQPLFDTEKLCEPPAHRPRPMLFFRTYGTSKGRFAEIARRNRRRENRDWIRKRRKWFVENKNGRG